MVQRERKVCHRAGKPIVYCAAMSRAPATEKTKMVNASLGSKHRILERAPRIFSFSMIRKAFLKSPGDVTCPVLATDRSPKVFFTQEPSHKQGEVVRRWSQLLQPS